jgi:putative ABC transport system permease protein
MLNLIKIAFRNLFRYKRRTLLTAILIVIGVVLVIVTIGFGSGFRNSVTSIFTDTSLSHLQIHKQGYVENVTTSPLDLFLDKKEMQKLTLVLDGNKAVQIYSPRINFSCMVSTYTETTNMKVTGIYPEKEAETSPALLDRISGITDKEHFIQPGQVIIPDAIAKAFSLKLGDPIVLVSTNRYGSINGLTLTITGILESYSGRYLRDGYVHIEDAKSILRMEESEISEVAVRLNDLKQLEPVTKQLRASLETGEPGLPNVYEIHTWKALSPFTSILVLVDMITNVIRLILIAIVLLSIMNIMMMAVYERTKEIGSISAMGTPARRIRTLFLMEGLTLGAVSVGLGLLAGVIVLIILNALKIVFTAGPFTLLLVTEISPEDLMTIAITVLIISIFASLQPAHKASRLDPVDALGHV